MHRHLYVADWGNHRLVKIEIETMQHIAVVGKRGTDQGKNVINIMLIFFAYMFALFVFHLFFVAKLIESRFSYSHCFHAHYLPSPSHLTI